jgi:hypothetical protein
MKKKKKKEKVKTQGLFGFAFPLHRRLFMWFFAMILQATKCSGFLPRF